MLKHMQQELYPLSIIPGLFIPNFMFRGSSSLNCPELLLTLSVVKIHREFVIPVPKFPEHCITNSAGGDGEDGVCASRMIKQNKKKKLKSSLLETVFY